MRSFLAGLASTETGAHPKRDSANASSVNDGGLQNLSAVFVGCARDVAPHLQGVLRNIERFSRLYARCAFVIVENDSSDETKSILKHWLKSRPHGYLLEMDGLAKKIPSRTARLACTRNAYIDHVRSSKFSNYQHLVVIDFDDVNAADIDVEGFKGAARYLENAPDAKGVFTNTLPVYYDIWALRHPEWCPTDCWREHRESSDLSEEDARLRYIYSRQFYIPSDTPPIPVQSAFGGIGIYALSSALAARYHGVGTDGLETCEHVSFNQEISRTGKLFIYPALLNHAPQEHLNPALPPLGDVREISLEQNGHRCNMLAPNNHLLDVYRKHHPLYDRRLPLLSKLISDAAPNELVIDVGANIGDTIVLCRLAGCTSEIIAVEPSIQYYSYLELNRRGLAHKFEGVHSIQAFIGPPDVCLALSEERGTASVQVVSHQDADGNQSVPTVSFDMIADQPVSLIKTDTDGYDAQILASNLDYIRRRLPVLWVETDTAGSTDESMWGEVLSDITFSHPMVCVFDNFGFLITHGELARKKEMILDLIGYARIHKSIPNEQVGEPRIYYLDLALFPERYLDVYHDFISRLPDKYSQNLPVGQAPADERL